MIMSKFLNILDGWKNYAFKDESVEVLAKSRAEVCSKCPFADRGSYQKLMPDYSMKEVQGMKCNKCGCPLSTKLRATDEKCPLKKWG